MKKIYSYDLNDKANGLYFFYSYANRNSIEINHVSKIEYAKDADTMIINTLSEMASPEYWAEIKKYISENEKTKVMIFSPSIEKSKLLELIGNSNNMEFISTKEMCIRRQNNWAPLLKILRESE